jgi:hypothetical protein
VKPTPEQTRLLTHLARSGQWVHQVELAHLKLLDDDDDLFVSSLVARGWAEVAPLKGIVRITDAGNSSLSHKQGTSNADR